MNFPQLELELALFRTQPVDVEAVTHPAAPHRAACAAWRRAAILRLRLHAGAVRVDRQPCRCRMAFAAP
jgi:hypothetical protein